MNGRLTVETQFTGRSSEGLPPETMLKPREKTETLTTRRVFTAGLETQL